MTSARRPTSRIVLVLPTETYRADAFMSAAAALDVEVVVATEQTPPLATEMEDRLVAVDLERPEASAARIAALAERSPVDAVVGVDDQGVLTAAHAGDLLGLAHNPPDAVAATRDKVAMRSILRSWGVPQPAFGVATPSTDVAALAQEVGLPCVVKPVSLSASTGVIRADTAAHAVTAAARVRRILVDHGHDADEAILVESFVPGAEVTLEGLLRGGELRVLALFDKPDPLDGPYFEETIYVTPSRLDVRDRDAVSDVVADGCRALGLREGPVHAEVRIDASRSGPARVRVLEIAARSIGGLCSRALRFGAGISLEELVLRHALGRDVDDLGRVDGAAGVMMLPIPRSGVLVGVAGIDEARAVDGITGVEITATRGRRIEQLPEGGRYLGFLFARADAPDRVESALREAHGLLRIDIEDPSSARVVPTAPPRMTVDASVPTLRRRP